MFDPETAQILILSAVVVALVGGFGVWDKHRRNR